MRVKRYVVDSMPDALQKIRSDLGKDAVIINTKEVRSGGFLGLFGKKKIEVIAATDTPTGGAGAPANLPKAPRKPAEPKPSAPPAAKPQSASAKEEVMPFVPDVLFEAKPEIAAASEPVKPAAQTAPGSSAPYAAHRAVEPAAARKPHEDKSKDETMLNEIRQMKEMMAKLAGGSAEARNPALAELAERMLDQEIAPQLVERIIGEVEKLAGEKQLELSPDTAFREVSDRLKAVLSGTGSKQIAPGTRIVHFVGPTGVGKTTTIAKLAAEQVLKQQRKVGFITSDTYRIAAVEQLKTYATILNVPLEVVFSSQDLKKAFAQLEHCDMIFMDTAGRNFRNEMYVSELNALLQTKGSTETILVLSLTAKYKDMRVITENFMKFKLDKVLFTKMDETSTYGSVVNLVSEFPLSLSYITNGQNVPDDIETLEEQQLVNLILEGKDHE